MVCIWLAAEACGHLLCLVLAAHTPALLQLSCLQGINIFWSMSPVHPSAAIMLLCVAAGATSALIALWAPAMPIQAHLQLSCKPGFLKSRVDLTVAADLPYSSARPGNQRPSALHSNAPSAVSTVPAD